MRIKNILTSLCFCAIALVSTGQINQVNSSGKKFGVWEKKYPNSTITRYKGQFENDLPVGLFKYYEPNGKLSLELNYVKPNFSESIAFSLKDGKPIAKGFYLNQKKDSLWTYLKNGRVVSTEQWQKDKLHGWVITYYESGKVVDSTHYSYGVKSGKYVYYFENGICKTSCNYKNNVLDGTYTEKDVKGNLVYVGKYLDGVRKGKWEFYSADGKLNYYTLQNGEKQDTLIHMNGEFTDTYPSGRPKRIANYQNGQLQGKYLEFYDNGLYELEEHTDNRSQTTEKYKVLKGQKKKFEATYTIGYLNGIAKEFDEDGKVTKQTLFKMGKVVEQ